MQIKACRLLTLQEAVDQTLTFRYPLRRRRRFQKMRDRRR